MGEELIFLGALVFAAHLFSMIFSKKKIPDVLLLMIIGIIIGPILKLVKPDFMGSAGAIFTSITLIVILFEGGIDISINDLKKSWKSTIRLSINSVILSILLVSLFGLIFQLSIINSLILGVILSGTSSAVVIPLTQHLKLGKETKTVLVLESAITDIICFVLALALMESERAGGGLNFGKITGGVASSFIMATIFGVIGGILWSSLLHKVRNFKNSIFLTPAYAFVIYGIVEYLGFSGAIAALTLGITMANIQHFNFPFLEKYQRDRNLNLTQTEKSFISEIVFVLKTFFFVYIGISIPFNNIIALSAGLIITIILMIMRLFVSKYTAPSSANGFDKSVIALMIPKGLAAAVLASIPEQMGLPQGDIIKSIVFSTVLFSILACSIMIFVIEKYPKANIMLRYLFNPKKNKTKISSKESKDFDNTNS